jgi:hypothetical protein
MSLRIRIGVAALLVAVGFGVVGNWGDRRSDEDLVPEAVPSVLPEKSPEMRSPERERADRLATYADDPLVGGLLDPEGTVGRDLELLSVIFEAWQSNFPGLGNPGGENYEITAALVGKNRFRLELIPMDHPAINDAGELCDRWGTPLFFHQLSGEQMEIRSAGPDREHYTDDDTVLTP